MGNAYDTFHTMLVICARKEECKQVMKKFLNGNRVIRTATKRTETSLLHPTQCTYVPNSFCAVIQQSGLGM